MTTITAMQVPRNDRISAGTWSLSILVSLGSVVIFAGLLKSIKMFDKMFKGLGVQLPTSSLVANYIWLFPLFHGGAAAFLDSQRVSDVARSAPIDHERWGSLSWSGVPRLAALCPAPAGF